MPQLETEKTEKLNSGGVAGTPAKKPPPPAVPAAKVPEPPVARPRLLDSLTSLEDNTEYTNVLWWGEESTGKTHNLASLVKLPGTGILIVVNSESGLKKGALKRFGFDTSRIKLWPPEGVAVTYNNLMRLRRQIAQQLADEPGSVLGVGFDSLTEIAAAALDSAVARGIKAAENRGNPREGDEFDIEQSDWGVMTGQIKKLLRSYRDLPCHFGATALERMFPPKAGVNAIEQIGPDLNPGLAGKVLGFFDFAIRTTADNIPIGEGESAMLTKGFTKKTKRIRAKDRDGVLPTVWPEPTFDRLVQYAQGDLTQDQDGSFAKAEAAKALNTKYVADKAAASQKKEN